MANVVEIVINGRDLSTPAIQQATKNVDKLGSSLLITREQSSKLRASMVALGAVMATGTTIAERFGNTMTANVGHSLIEGTGRMAMIVGLLGKTKLGMVALGAEAVKLGLELADAFKPILPASLQALFHTAADTAREEAATRLAQDLNAMMGQLIRSSDFGRKFSGGGQRGYQTYTGEQGAEVLAMNRDLDAMLENYKRFTTDKEAIAAFAEKIDKERTRRMHDLHVRFDQDELKRRAQLHQRYAETAADILGNLAAVASAFGKKGFEAFKAFRIAEAIAATYAGAAKAIGMVELYPFNFVLAASVIAAGLANVATIAATKPQGQAHGGLDYVPNDSTFLLQQGERVVQRRQNERLTEFLDKQSPSGNTVVVVNLDGRELFRAMGHASEDGRLVISARGVR